MRVFVFSNNLFKNTSFKTPKASGENMYLDAITVKEYLSSLWEKEAAFMHAFISSELVSQRIQSLPRHRAIGREILSAPKKMTNGMRRARSI